MEKNYIIKGDYLEDKKYTEREIRALYLKEEISDISNNIEEYIDEILDISSECDFIKLAVYGDIEPIIANLNSAWGYEIECIEEEE